LLNKKENNTIRNKMNLCFDLDGPIIDVSDRYYRAYLESLIGTGANSDHILRKEDFWKLKQNRISDLEIGILSGLSVKDSITASEARRDLNFKEDFLYMDKVFDDVFDTFEYIKSKNINFFVVTLRRKKQLNPTIKQFKLNKYINLDKFFPLADEEKIQNDIQGKHILVVNAHRRLGLNTQETWIIGDSDTDVHVGRLARLGKIIAIDRGIRSREQLEVLRPDYLINNLKELTGFLS